MANQTYVVIAYGKSGKQICLKNYSGQEACSAAAEYFEALKLQPQVAEIWRAQLLLGAWVFDAKLKRLPGGEWSTAQQC